MPLTNDEIGRRIEALRAAKKRAVEAGDPRATPTGDEIDRAIEDRERKEQQVATATTGSDGEAGRAPPPKCENCGRPKTPKARGWWCKPCRDAARSGVAPTPVVNPRPARPTYERPTALERQMSPAPGPAPAPAPPPESAPILAEVEAMRAVVLALAPLDTAAVARVIRWLSERFVG